jgi:hypothetical protein
LGGAGVLTLTLVDVAAVAVTYVVEGFTLRHEQAEDMAEGADPAAAQTGCAMAPAMVRFAGAAVTVVVTEELSTTTVTDTEVTTLVVSVVVTTDVTVLDSY